MNIITLTDAAVDYLLPYLKGLQDDKDSMKIGIRITINRKGCNGYEYDIEPLRQIFVDDIEFIERDVIIVIHPIDEEILSGVELDYVTEGINTKFKFNNPKATALCGCGKSFSI